MWRQSNIYVSETVQIKLHRFLHELFPPPLGYSLPPPPSCSLTPSLTRYLHMPPTPSGKTPQRPSTPPLPHPCSPSSLPSSPCTPQPPLPPKIAASLPKKTPHLFTSRTSWPAQQFCCCYSFFLLLPLPPRHSTPLRQTNQTPTSQTPRPFPFLLLLPCPPTRAFRCSREHRR